MERNGESPSEVKVERLASRGAFEGNGSGASSVCVSFGANCLVEGL